MTARQVRGGDQPRYQLEVADTGIGMSAEFLQRLFEPYARELRFSAAQAGGTGLGMAITKSLVAQMDGRSRSRASRGRVPCSPWCCPLPPPGRRPSPRSRRSRTPPPWRGCGCCGGGQ